MNVERLSFVQLLVFVIAFLDTCRSPLLAWQKEGSNPAPQSNQILAQRNELIQRAETLLKSEKHSEAIELVKAVVRLERGIYPNGHPDLMKSLKILGDLHHELGDHAAASAAHTEALSVCGQLFGKDNWRTIDFRLDVLDTQRLASFSKAELAAFDERNVERDRFISQVKQAESSRNWTEAISAQEKVLDLTEVMFGQKHREYIVNLNNLGNVHLKAGKTSQAESCFQKSLEIAPDVIGKSHPDYASILQNSSMLLQGRARFREALPLSNSITEIMKSAFGQDDPRHARALTEHAFVLRTMGQFLDAKKQLQQARAIYGPLGDQFAFEVVSCDHNLGLLLQETSDFSDAEQHLLAAEKEILRRRGNDDRGYRTVISNLALLYHQRGDMETALNYCKRLLDMIEQNPDMEAEEIANLLNTCGVVHQTHGDFGVAEAEFQRALEKLKTSLEVHHHQYTTIQTNVAALYKTRGKWDEALQLIEQVIQDLGTTVGQQHFDYFNAMNTLASIYSERGDIDRALGVLRELLKLVRSKSNEANLDSAGIVNNLASGLMTVGDLTQAQSMLVECLGGLKPLGESYPLALTIQSNLAQIHERRGEFDQAQELLSKVLAVCLRSTGEKSTTYLVSMNTRLLIFIKQQRFGEAEEVANRLLNLRRLTVGENHIEYAKAINNLAAVYEVKGDYSRAISKYEEAIEVMARNGIDERHHEYANTLGNIAAQYRNLAILNGDKKSASKAIDLYRRTLRGTDQFLSSTFSVLSERQRLSLQRTLRRTLDGYLSVPEVEQSPMEAYGQILLWKGAISMRAAAEQAAAEQAALTNPELRPKLAELSEVRARLAQSAFDQTRGTEPSTWTKQVNRLFGRKEELEADLASQGLELAVSSQPPKSKLKNVADSLGPSTILIDFLEYRHLTHSTNRRGGRDAERRFLAVVVEPGKALRVVRLDSASKIEKAILNWQQALLGSDRTRIATAANDVAGLVWQPLNLTDTNDKTVIVAPDGALCRLPFGALPGENHDYLIEEVPIGYAVSGMHAAHLSKVSAENMGNGLFWVGNVDYGPGATEISNHVAMRQSNTADKPVFARLEGLAEDSDWICRLFEETHSGKPVIRLSGTEPSEERIKRELQNRWQILHIDSHGFFFESSQIKQVRGRNDDTHVRADGADSMKNEIFFQNPLLNSGIAVANANAVESATDKTDDGILTAEELIGLNFQGTDFVFLPICDSGLGQIEAGEGVFGVQRAFQVGGARSVAMALWQVDHKSTRRLIKEFYSNLWVKKLPKLQALRQAQLTVMRGPGDSDHPAIWAAWVLSGDPGDLHVVSALQSVTHDSGIVNPITKSPFQFHVALKLGGIVGVVVLMTILIIFLRRQRRSYPTI